MGDGSVLHMIISYSQKMCKVRDHTCETGGQVEKFAVPTNTEEPLVCQSLPGVALSGVKPILILRPG